MYKKRSIGVSIIGGWLILQGFISTISYYKRGIVSVILGITLMIIGVGLLRLYKYAPISAIAIYSAVCLINIIALVTNQQLEDNSGILATFIISVFILIGLVFFFTRHQVKEQFK